jgi:hypothetical protein
MPDAGPDSARSRVRRSDVVEAPAVLVACQRHVASLLPDTRFEVAIHASGPTASQTSAAFTILHQFSAG